MIKNPSSAQGQRIQEFILDSQSRTVVFRQHSQRLTRIVFRLLEHLFQHEGCLVPRLELLQAVWGTQVTVEPRTVDSHIVRLRRKLRAIWNSGLRY